MLMFTTTDLVAIWTKVPTDKGEHEVIIASAYLPGDEETAPTRELVALVNYCKENHLRWIIGCDANAHHTIWGSTNINARGECLLEFLLRYNVSIVNRGNEPTFRNAIREEVLDLTLCSPNVLSEVSNWHVSGEASMSDHSLIRFDLGATLPHITIYRNPRNINWNVFHFNLEQSANYSKHHLVLKSELEMECKEKRMTIQDLNLDEIRASNIIQTIPPTLATAP
ncbi:uncharacterized protein LOC128869756 [Anastrepha ludens]|uniref:uncharacterized protein LOC128869756 n=1 Tax=Anastrepha ludens TaxID=28586 RepID=UPI0023B00986|nr:uncharacterized protein LOC128869756 [Anastrepha ludens]